MLEKALLILLGRQQTGPRLNLDRLRKNVIQFSMYAFITTLCIKNTQIESLK